jgi:hypothetical protein
MVSAEISGIAKSRFLILLHLLLLCCLSQVKAQEEQSGDSIIISRLKGQFTFDGRVDDECWVNATSLPVIMHTPVFGEPPSQETDFLIAFDDDYIYLAGRMYDKTPEKIMASSRVRDEWSTQNDYLIWIFDTFLDHENGLIFATTPEGVRVDATVLNDATDLIMPYSKEWNTFWDVKTSMNEKGWFAEIRIPLSSLRFQPQNGKVNMGLIALRYRPVSSEVDVFPAIPDKWGFWSWMKVSRAERVVFNGLKMKRPFYIAPYAIGGINQESELTSDGNSRNLNTDPKLNGGLDVKYGLTQNLTMDISLNTDFAQVEADMAQINLTRFSLFFPEKRNFFLERSSNFSFAFDEQNSITNNLFYSRRIGLADDQYPVPIYGGARLVGRAGKWDIGFLDMQTHSFEHPSDSLKNLPGENFGVLRLRRQVFNSNSYAGGIITSLIGTDGSYNLAYGLDGIFRIAGENYFDAKWVQTFDNTNPDNTNGLDNSRIWIDLKNRKLTGFGYDVYAGHAGKFYQPGIGYEQRSDFNQIGTKLLYGWLMKPKSKIYSQTFTIKGQQWTENKTNIIQTRLFYAGYELKTKSGADINIMLNRSTENITDEFTIMESATVPAGRYDYSYIYSMLNSPYGKKYFLQAILRFGQFYDGSLISMNFMPICSFGPGFKLEGVYEYDMVKFPLRNENVSGHIASVKLYMMLSTKFSFTTFIQYNSAGNSILTNLRLRYNPREGNDFYIVFNEGRNTFLHSETPPLQRIEGRSLVFKYTYTFVL